jgi:hypothetical protein
MALQAALYCNCEDIHLSLHHEAFNMGEFQHLLYHVGPFAGSFRQAPGEYPPCWPPPHLQ